MDDKPFLQYLNSDEVHDGTIRQVISEEDRVRVLVDTADGRVVSFEFTGVREVKENRPEGMLLYSLSELGETAPLRRFVFTNWEEEEEGDACLEITALELSSKELNRQQSPPA